MSFSQALPRIPLDRLLTLAEGASKTQVDRVLSKETRTLEDFAAFISPAAGARLG